MPKIDADIPDTLYLALHKYLEQHPAESLGEVLAHAIKVFLEEHSDVLYQVSTASALVEGVYRGAVSVEKLLEHGDLGLGTFEDLDGEMIIVNGEVFQARSDATVRKVGSEAKTPFAVVSHFQPTEKIYPVDCDRLQRLEQQFDELRESDNLFYALRVTGLFDTMHLRAMCKTAEGVPLVKAAGQQPEFHYQNIEGTLVGFWSPIFAKSLNVPGYHLHFLSREQNVGGHLLNCSGKALRLELQREVGFTAVLPENDRYLHADLSRDSSRDLEAAEKAKNPND